MWINYHHLYYFKTIAEEQSVSKAAEKLRLGQPTLSAQLKQFEDYLGVKLFERFHKKLVLTEQGKLALQYAQNIFRLGNEMVDALQDRLVPEKMKLQIGSLDSISKTFLSDLTEFCFQQSPVQIGFIEGSLDYLLRELDAHRIDLIVSNYLPVLKEHQKMNYRLIKKEQVSFFGSENFKNLRKRFPESLSGQKMLLPSYESKIRGDLDHWFQLQKLVMDVVAESQDLALKKQLALRGQGLVACAASSVSDLLEKNLLFEIGQIEGVTEDLYFMSIERKIANPFAQKLMKEFSINT